VRQSRAERAGIKMAGVAPAHELATADIVSVMTLVAVVACACSLPIDRAAYETARRLYEGRAGGLHGARIIATSGPNARTN
jgi:hypothetical protein